MLTSLATAVQATSGRPNDTVTVRVPVVAGVLVVEDVRALIAWAENDPHLAAVSFTERQYVLTSTFTISLYGTGRRVTAYLRRLEELVTTH